MAIRILLSRKLSEIRCNQAQLARKKLNKTTYGIKCEKVSVKDVSPNKEEVTELIDRLNQYVLSPCHLQDVIEDFI